MKPSNVSKARNPPIRTDGENRTLQVTGAPRFDKMGHFIGTFGIFRDITDDKKAEEALTRAEVRYRQLVEKIRAVTYLDAVDEQSTTLFISPQIVSLSGYTSEEWLSDANLWLDIIYPDDRELVYAEHIKTNQLRGDFCQEYRIITRDGRIVWVHDEASLLQNDKGDPEGWHGVIYDITERKWAEEELQNAHRNLAEAYDATIEGWSRALDLRDRETEGHTLRVTEMALQFAQMLGTNNEEMKHVRRGALLHDIGKMGVPDHILQKPGPLNENEWEIMRLHPFYAYQMLSPISYLRPALDIPFCHHEKWNGSGYPRGMKAEEIPLTARMFAIVDVWDALCSDRPYRRAWPEDKVIDYIRTQSGSHFEPKLVDIFFHLIGRNSGPAG
jgi:PAS domain S-box-containing protein/putative nucleotidyltransferase with HDIG domain